METPGTPQDTTVRAKTEIIDNGEAGNGAATQTPEKSEKGPMRDRPLLFLDLETTGLNPSQHEITEIGAVLVSPQGWEVQKIYEAKVLPTHLETATPIALEIGHFDPAVWEKEGRPLRQALEELSEVGRDAILAGFNLTFDWAFLQTAFNQVSLPDPFYYHRYDVMSAAFSLVYNRPEFVRFSLSECCRFFGVTNRAAHTALADAQATYEVFLGLMKLQSDLETKTAPQA